MTMQSSGPISIGQARNECQLGNPIDAGNAQLVKLAGLPYTQRYAWSYWYGKSFGATVTEAYVSFSTITGGSYSGACNTNLFGGDTRMYVGSGNVFVETGAGFVSQMGSYPNQLLNNMNVAGFFRRGTAFTIVCNGNLNGMTFTSTIGDNLPLTSSISITRTYGSQAWTYFGAAGTINNGGPRTYIVNLTG